MPDFARTSNLMGAAALAVADSMRSAVSAACHCGVSEAAALTSLVDEPGIGVSELASRIGLSQPAAARLVAALVSKEFVVRHPGRDSRSVSLHLSAKGKRLVRQALHAREESIARVLESLGTDERAVMTDVLERILSAVYGNVRNEHLICRLCDRSACISGGEICPVGQAAKASGQ